MLHAHMRRLARTRDFDESAYGAPINQVDLGRTWMDFTVTSYQAEEDMGFGLTSAETASLYRYWWVVAHLLGIEPELVEGISTHAQARRVDEMFQAVTGPLIPEAGQLAHATLDSIADLLNEVLNVPETLGSIALHSLARRFHSPAVADEMTLRNSAVADRVLTAAIGRVSAYRARLRKNPERWDEAIRKEIRETREAVGEVNDPLYRVHTPEEELDRFRTSPAGGWGSARTTRRRRRRTDFRRGRPGQPRGSRRTHSVRPGWRPLRSGGRRRLRGRGR